METIMLSWKHKGFGVENGSNDLPFTETSPLPERMFSGITVNPERLAGK